MTNVLAPAVGMPLDRIDGVPKVTGAAIYAYENPVADVTYLYPIQSPIAAGTIAAINPSAALALPGVLAVLSHENAPRLHPVEPAPPNFLDMEVSVLQSPEVTYHGQFVAAVVARTLEIAQEAAGLVDVVYDTQPHRIELRTNDPDLFRPERVNAGHPTDTATGDVEVGLASAAVTIDQIYTTPAVHNNPMEPHSTIAVWGDDGLTLYESTQNPHLIKSQLGAAFGLPKDRVRVISPYVGGGFGAKVLPHPHLALTAMAAKISGRPVKLALTRRQMSAIGGYRTPTIQRIRLGADDGGKLIALSHDVVEQTSIAHTFAEQTAICSRLMYAAPNLSTTHRLARLNVPHPTFMRAPGECPGMFALESAMDELATATGIDPVELRIRNLATTDPGTGLPFSSHGAQACLREGARRFGWAERVAHREGRWLYGRGVATSTYPARRAPGRAQIKVMPDGMFDVQIGAADIGTGSRTILTQIAADALSQPVDRIRLDLGDTALPVAPGAGGSMGTASWGTAIVDAATKLLERLVELNGIVPAQGVEMTGEALPNPEAQRYSMHAFGAQFAEVRVDLDTSEVRAPHLLGVFACGRIINPKMARSQLIGGMTMGLSMALHEESVLDPHSGDYVNRDLASYHIAAHADVGTIEAFWIDEDDPHLNPMGAKGVGEIGIVGTAAAIANAVADATGIRVRDLPINADRLGDLIPQDRQSWR